ncbi:MAG: hypothetical protein QME55_10025 [Brevundimonas sp.]|uniref:hypothetical protein n=1 Tax=Brevundimonas sp. TaxID=1871086 RepID=UPI00262EE962|nr:hypothetical protein [Brevundimonas sp.]MDI6625055.1 hypothetical protein [Brevundimonas sp.]MDQ7813646.1 hypothetical protein [Brevundimonas sp.]
MSYDDDFAGVDAVGAPLDPTIMIGADPMFWGAVLLAVLVAAMIGWLIGADSRSKRADAAGAIWKAIDDAAKAAMKADTEALPARASDLHRILRARLGKTLKFGGELTGCVDALARALKGEGGHGGEPSGHEPPPEEDATAARHDANAPASSAAANVTIVSIHPTATDHPGRPGHSKRSMTTKERNDALRLAVADFNDYWRHRSAREGDMRAVIAELSNPGPRRPPLSHGAAHH